jgi:hypothetical protein
LFLTVKETPLDCEPLLTQASLFNWVSTVYEVIAEPPLLDGADHVAVIVLSDAEALRLVTAVGTVTGVAPEDIEE